MFCRFPPPAKIVGYCLQAYEALPVHQQYLLKVGSIYDYGFSVEMLRPLIQDERKSKLTRVRADVLLVNVYVGRRVRLAVISSN